MTDQEIIKIKQETKPYTKQWGETLAFAHALIAAYEKSKRQPHAVTCTLANCTEPGCGNVSIDMPMEFYLQNDGSVSTQSPQCHIEVFSSRMCEHGTPSCTTRHEVKE